MGSLTSLLFDINAQSIYPLIKDILDEMDGNPVIRLARIAQQRGLPDYFLPLRNMQGDEYKKIKAYLENRNLSVDYIAEQTLIGYARNNTFTNSIIIPTDTGYIARSISGKKTYRKECSGNDFVQSDAMYRNHTGIFTEGWGCAMTFQEFGTAYNAATLTPQQVFKISKSPLEKVYFAPDKGVKKIVTTKGEKSVKYTDLVAKSVIDLAFEKEVYIIDLNLTKEAGKDPNEIGIDRMLEYMDNPKITKNILNLI